VSIRPIKRLITSRPTIEGAGVYLRRAFGFYDTSDFDPFFLSEDFRNDVPEDFLAGIPWHPHRGIETITYVLAGTVEHGNSIGNRGTIAAGDVQWMTAGRGIIHREMPKGVSGQAQDATDRGHAPRRGEKSGLAVLRNPWIITAIPTSGPSGSAHARFRPCDAHLA
jgi:redox-sensitive bicupin YhaK (pirin superfamily)